MIRSITFFVAGIPVPGGSKKFVGKSKKTGKAILVDAAGQRNKDWRANVAWNAHKAIGEKGQFEDGPLAVNLTFYMPRPKSHLRQDGTLRAFAPRYPTTAPDALKLARAVEDAMTGIVYRDDSLTVALTVSKRYANRGDSCGCRVEVTGAGPITQ